MTVRLTTMSTVRIVILGDRKVGKSAVTVRFLTRRFIGEYSSDIDLLYRSSIRQEDLLTDVEVLDTCTRTGQSVRVDETRFTWADAFVVVYSILNRTSFYTAKSLIESINRLRNTACIPLMLLGNMTDLDHRREVGVDEGHQVALEQGCQYFEVSAAENIVGITLAFQAFLREARIVQHQKSTLLKRRRNSLANMSKRLGAMFGKNKDNNNNNNNSGNNNNSNSNNSSSGVGGSSVGGVIGSESCVSVSPLGRRGSIDVKDLLRT